MHVITLPLPPASIVVTPGPSLPRSVMRKRYAYSCPHCDSVLERVRRIRYIAACYDCCRKHNRGRFSQRYRLQEAVLA